MSLAGIIGVDWVCCMAESGRCTETRVDRFSDSLPKSLPVKTGRFVRCGRTVRFEAPSPSTLGGASVFYRRRPCPPGAPGPCPSRSVLCADQHPETVQHLHQMMTCTASDSDRWSAPAKSRAASPTPIACRPRPASPSCRHVRCLRGRSHRHPHRLRPRRRVRCRRRAAPDVPGSGRQCAVTGVRSHHCRLEAAARTLAPGNAAVSLRIDIVQFRRVDQRRQNGPSLASGIRAGAIMPGF